MKLALVLIAALQLAAAFGQVQVRGTVTDTSGATVGGATASVQFVATRANAASNVKQVWETKTGADGKFSFAVGQGQYSVCAAAQGFETSCTEISVRDEPSVAVSMILHLNENIGLVPSSMMDSRLRQLSGDKAFDCGRVETRKSPTEASACVLRQFHSGQPFLVRYDLQGIDSEVAVGLASTSSIVYTVAFDSYGTSPLGLSQLPKGSTLMDEHHNVVLACPAPVKLRMTPSGKVTCLGARKRDLLFLGPDF